MPRKSPTLATLRSLFAKSGNRCSYPDCVEPLVDENDLFVAEICHIEGASPGGPRYNPNSNDDQRRSFDNLILLCHRHHVTIDHYSSKYTVKAIKEIKEQHHMSFTGRRFDVNVKTLKAVRDTLKIYWTHIYEYQKMKKEYREYLHTPKNVSNIDTLFRDIYRYIRRLEAANEMLSEDARILNQRIILHLKTLGYDTMVYETVPYYENPFENRNWEEYNMLMPNVLNELRMRVLQVEVFHLHIYLAYNPDDIKAKEALEKATRRMQKLSLEVRVD